ncbi:uncharacterized protein HD556DRAFT_1444899 [Suillus plorans]|uniref:Uncharacterized protein n=1 Tax=Suillus plorans TaxID=116603 RepID=A0A9P7ALQ1_9AGAM|nr:uncharacterized protein HD556DRAFT_1444899 [Suillus plorans]KAG1791822.1 hypothetical protein HD556DRAFT_1444899 [Suillus plorans]
MTSNSTIAPSGSARVRVTRAGHRYGYYWGTGTGRDSKTRALTRTPAIPVPSINAILPVCTLQPAPPPSTQTSCRQRISSRLTASQTTRLAHPASCRPDTELAPATTSLPTPSHSAVLAVSPTPRSTTPTTSLCSTLTDATSKHHPAPTRHADSPASSVHAQTTPANAGVAQMHTEDTRTKREGKDEEREEEGMILSVSRRPDSAPIFCNEDATPDTSHSRATTPPSPISTCSPSTSIVCDTTCHDISVYFDASVIRAVPPLLLLVPSTYVRVTSAFADVCWTYVLSTGGDTYCDTGYKTYSWRYSF